MFIPSISSLQVDQMTKGDVEFDVPFRELGFHGVPHRETVLLQPTTNCLVHLTNWVGGLVEFFGLDLPHFISGQLNPYSCCNFSPILYLASVRGDAERHRAGPL